MVDHTQALEEVKKAKATFIKNVDITEKAIISRGKELKEFVDQCTWSLLEDLKNLRCDGLEAIESETEKLETAIQLSLPDRTSFKSTAVPADGSHEDFAQIQQPSNAPTQERILSLRFFFEISKLNEFLEGNNIIGKIKREDNRLAVETEDIEFQLHQEQEISHDEATDEEIATEAGEDNRLAVETEDIEFQLHQEQEIPHDEATDEEIATEAEDKQLTVGPLKIETEFPEKEAISKKKKIKTKTSKRKIPDRFQIGQQDVQKLPLLCARYTYRDQRRSDPQVCKSQSISLVKTLCLPRVWGVTKLEDRIYVLSWMPNSIHVYEDSDPFPLHNEIPIEEIRNPEDIASNMKTKCLYVSDIQDKCIWQISLDDHHQVTKWLSSIDWPFTMSVSSDGHLLLLRDMHTPLHSVLEIYGSEASLIQRLPLSPAIQQPLHAIQKPNGQFIIVHRLNDRETGPWVISHLTSDGNLIGNFIPKAETLGLLDWPFRMAIDTEYERLFVADYWNHRVIRIDSFSWAETILKQTINRPLRLHYDVKKKQLIVANSRRLDIYLEH